MTPHAATALSTVSYTPEQHNQRASEYLDLATEIHKEAARHFGSGDNRSGMQQAQLAQGHYAKASEHIFEATRKAALLANVSGRRE
jgi:hypothetical protein